MENDNAIESHLRREIRKARPGHRMPSVRSLQSELRASPVTIQRAVARLVADGLLVTRPGDGTFVTDAARRVSSRDAETRNFDTSWQAAVLGRAPQVPTGIDHLGSLATGAEVVLDNGFPEPSLQPHRLLSQASAAASRRPQSWDRCLPEGMVRLRGIVAAELGPGFAASDVLITPGAQAALDSIFRTFLRPGDPVLVEEPGYPGAIGAAILAGLVPLPVPTDGEGMRTDDLERILSSSGARLVVVQPRHANPTGATLSGTRRVELLELARRFGAFVVEDDWVRDLDLDPDKPSSPPLVQSDMHGHVVYLRSFSKSTAPGVRVAAVVARGPAWSRLRAARLLADFFAAPLLQETLADVLVSSAWPRHLKALRAELRDRRDSLADALRGDAPTLAITRPTGGVVLWARLPDGVDEAAMVEACRGRGVRVGAGRPFWLAEPPASFVRLSFAGADTVALASASVRIGAALGEVGAEGLPHQVRGNRRR
jgi:DNA-binding transcriptional MocR family regulator